MKRKNPVMITQFLRKCIITFIGNVIRMPFVGSNYPDHKIKGCNSGKTKSHAIIEHDLVPAECIYKVLSQNGDRILFERHSTPRPAPKVIMKSNRQSQQQQSICDDVSTSTSKLVTDQIGIRDVRGYATDDQTSTRKLVRNPEPPVDTKPQFEIDLRKGVSQDAVLQDEAKVNEINEKLEKV